MSYQFEVGQKVISEYYGTGTIVSISNARVYRIKVDFINGSVIEAGITFTLEGKYLRSNSTPRKNIKPYDPTVVEQQQTTLLIKSDRIIEVADNSIIIVYKRDIRSFRYGTIASIYKGTINVPEDKIEEVKEFLLGESNADEII